MTRDELLAALLVERLDNRWWKTPAPAPVDDELPCARRRRAAARDSARGAA